MRRRGQALIQTLGLLLIVLIAGGFAVDADFYFAVHQGMQNASNAAALAGASELFDYVSTNNNDSNDLVNRFSATRSAAE